MSENRPAKDIRVVGLRRTGNHAVINWIIKQHQGAHCFLNDLRPLSPDSPCWDAPPEDYDANCELLVHSYEDIKLNYLARGSLLERWQRSFLGTAKLHFDVLILRDPFNLFASRRKGLGGKGQSLDKAGSFGIENLWIQYAREFVGQSAYLHDKIVINYNRWCIDRAYREEIAADLEMPFTDAGFEEVPPNAGGSSFDGQALDGNAQTMKTRQRWAHFRDDPDYLALFRDPELLRLARRIFDLEPELEDFVAQSIEPRLSGGAALQRRLRFAVHLPLAALALNLRVRLQSPPFLAARR